MTKADLVGKSFKDARVGSDVWTVSEHRGGICELKSDRRSAFRYHAASKILDRRNYREVGRD